jgi:Helix-turn-helix
VSEAFPSPSAGWPDPERIGNLADFVLHLDRLRRRAARGTVRQRVGLDALARQAGIPRSTLHTYLAGLALPPADRLDRMVLALGCPPSEAREWAQARDRIADVIEMDRPVASAGDDLAGLPAENARVKARRARGLDHCSGLVDWSTPVHERMLRASPPSPGPVVLPAVVASTWVGTYVYRDPSAASVRTGYLHPGNNWFICQTLGGPAPAAGGSPVSHTWIYTQADIAHDHTGGWGWLPAIALTGYAGAGPVPGIPWLRPESAVGG